jgi:hypothetical protein
MNAEEGNFRCLLIFPIDLEHIFYYNSIKEKKSLCPTCK